jgi:hypothetical protein
MPSAVTNSDKGSATVEFVIFVLPLLVSALVFFSLTQQQGIQQSQGRALAREAVQSFIEAPNDIDGYLRVSAILQTHQKISGSKGEITFSVTCSSRPCIAPSNRVMISIFSKDDQDREIEIGRAQSSVSRWIS